MRRSSSPGIPIVGLSYPRVRYDDLPISGPCDFIPDWQILSLVWRVVELAPDRNPRADPNSVRLHCSNGPSVIITRTNRLQKRPQPPQSETRDHSDEFQWTQTIRTCPS
jgi:hypothetical protein